MPRQFVKLLLPKLDKIRFDLFVDHEDISIRGNAIATMDDEFNTEYENELIKRVSNGDFWAWCQINLTASYHGIKGTPSYLGTCSYKDEKEFYSSDAYADMQKEAFSNLMDKIRAMNN